MRIINIFLIIVLFLIIFSCSKEQEVVCNKPYIIVGSECCLDKNGNSICDFEDEIIDENIESEEVTCNKPYILVGNDCCLDENDNQICDKDEAKLEGENIDNALSSVVTILNKNGDPFGSGFIVDEDGYILTNFHVIIEDYYSAENWYTVSPLKARTINKKEYSLAFIGGDYFQDIAIMKIKEPDRKFPFLKLSENSGRIGDVVYSLGAPYGAEFSVTKGIISQKNRESYLSDKPKYRNYLQMDAAINPGNSGGPIVNGDGEVVAMSTFGIANSEGLGYGLQSEKLIKLYDNEIYKNMSLLAHVEVASTKSYSKDVVIASKSVTLKSKNTEEYAEFYGFKYSIDNKLARNISICYRVEFMNYLGHKEYARDLSYKTNIMAKRTIIEDYNTDVKFESNEKLFYRILVNDCDTNANYGMLYGPGFYVFIPSLNN